ncbi:MAG: hypothetical protein ABIR56_15915 [Polaromonas sp.]
MKRWVKWTVGVLAALVVVAAAAAVVGSQLAERKSQRQVKVNLQPVAWATALAAPDASTLARVFNSMSAAAPNAMASTVPACRAARFPVPRPTGRLLPT